jgi:hypothetical protein
VPLLHPQMQRKADAEPVCHLSLVIAGQKGPGPQEWGGPGISTEVAEAGRGGGGKAGQRPRVAAPLGA